jgi:hypothetical protein
MNDPTSDPNFTGVKQPAFDELVGGHARTTGLLDQLAHDLWVQLNRLGVDTSPALRIRALAARIGEQVLDLRSRQARVHAMEKQGAGAELCLPSGTFWKLPSEPQPGKSGNRPRDFPDLSYELDDAELLTLPSVDPNGTRFSPAQDAVLSWIELNRDTINREAKARHIPPTAITAAIAWEAIENNWQPFRNPIPPTWPLHGLERHASGPGKVHVNSTLVREIEARGYLPHMNVTQRDAYLRTDAGSIKYIAAIMSGFADVSEQDGRFPSIRNDVPMLTSLYQGGRYEGLDGWARELREKQPGTPFKPGNDMPLWVEKNPEYLEAMDEALHSFGHPTFVHPTPTPGPSPTPP